MKMRHQRRRLRSSAVQAQLATVLLFGKFLAVAAVCYTSLVSYTMVAAAAAFASTFKTQPHHRPRCIIPPPHRDEESRQTSVGLIRLCLNRFLFDPSEVCMACPELLLQDSNDNDSHTDDTATTTDKVSSSVSIPTVTIPKDDYRTVHAAKILGLKNGDTIRAGIVSSMSSTGDESPIPCSNSSVSRAEEQSITTFLTTHGLLTDTATVKWIPEGMVKKAEPLRNGNPPGSLRIYLHSLKEPSSSSSSSDSSSQGRLLGVSLILALPRPLQLGRMIPMIAQMGVDHLVLTHAKKVPRDYFGSHLFRKPHELTSRLVEGLSQSGDVRLPEIHIVRPSDYSQFWKTRRRNENDDNDNISLLDRLFPRDEYARVVAHPQRTGDSAMRLPRMRDVQFPNNKSQQQQRKLVLAVGPEGGWQEPEELDMLVGDDDDAAGFQIITMGPRVLKSDCAVVSLLALGHDVVAI